MADQAEDNSKKDVVVEPDTSAETSTRLSEAGNDSTYKPPTASVTDHPGQTSPDVQRILDKFSIIGQEAGKDTRWGFIIGGGEEINGSGAFADTLADRRGKKQPTDANGRPISNGEINTAFRALIDGARNQTPPMEMKDIYANLSEQLKGTGYDIKFDPNNPDRLTLVDSRNLDNKGNPREVSRYDLQESPEETGERMANRTLDPSMTVGQQEAFVNQGLTKMLATMPEADRERFLSEYNKKMEDAGSDQRLEFKDGKANLNPPTDATLPKGLRLENVGKYTDLRDAVNDGDLSAQDVLDHLKESTADLDPRQARLFNAETTKLLQQKYGSEFSISADQNGQNQKLEVQLSKQPPIKVDVPAGMSMEDAQQWVKSAGELQKIAGSPAETYQTRLTDFMGSEQGKKLLEAFGNLPDEASKRQFIDGVNRLIPENVKGDFQFGLSADGQGMDLNRPGDAFKLRFGDTKLGTFLPPDNNAERDAVWSRKPEGVAEQNKKAYLDAISDLTSDKPDVRGSALRSLRETMRTLPKDQQQPFLEGINAELKAAGKDFRITNTDDRVEARKVVEVNGNDVTVPRYLEGNPAQVEAFRDLAQRTANGEDLTQLTKGANDLTANLGFYGRQEVINSLNGLLPESQKGNFRFEQGGSGIELQASVGKDAQGNPRWMSIPAGLDLNQANTLRDLSEKALAPGSSPASLASDLMQALKPPMTAEQQKSFLNAFNEQFKQTHDGKYFTQNGNNLDLNQSQLLPSFISSPVLDTFRSDDKGANLDNLLRSADFENPGANPGVDKIRDAFNALREDPSNPENMKALLTSLKDANFNPQQIEALKRAFNSERTDGLTLNIKDGIVQVGDTTAIRTADGKISTFTGKLDETTAQNLKFILERTDPGTQMTGDTVKLISDTLSKLNDPGAKTQLVDQLNAAFKERGETESIAQHPSGKGLQITDANGTRWVKDTGVQATQAEVTADALERINQNPTDAKTMVAELERNPEALTSEVERMLESGGPPYSPEVQNKIQALYQNGSETTKELIQRSLTVVGDADLARKTGMPEDALKIVELSQRIKTEGLDKVGTELSELLTCMTASARAQVIADLQESVKQNVGRDASIAFNDQNELILKKGNTVVDGYPNGTMGKVLDAMRAKGIADPYVINNLGRISDAFNQIKANDPAGLKAFLEQLSVAKLDASTQAKLVAGLNEHFHTNVSMNEHGVITDGTNSFKLAEVNGKAIAVPGSLSADLVSKLGKPGELVAELTKIAKSPDVSQLALIAQVGSGEYKGAVEQALINSGRSDAGQLARSLGLNDSASYIEIAAKLKAVNIDASAISNLSDIQSKVSSLSTPPTAEQMRNLLSTLRSSGLDLGKQGDLLKAIAGDKASIDASGILVAGNQRMLEFNGKFVNLPEGFTKVDQLKALMGSLRGSRVSNESIGKITELLKDLPATSQQSLITELNSVIKQNGGNFNVALHPSDGVVITSGSGMRTWAHADGRVATPAENIADLLSRVPADTASRTELLKLADTNIDAFRQAMQTLVDKASSGDANAKAQLASLYNNSNEYARALIEQGFETSKGSDSKSLAQAIGMSPELVAAAGTRDVQAATENKIREALGTSATPELVASIAEKLGKLQEAYSTGNPADALQALATAAKGKLTPELIASLNSQISGFRLAIGSGTLALLPSDASKSPISVSTLDKLPGRPGEAIAATGEISPEVYNPGDMVRIVPRNGETNTPLLEIPNINPPLSQRMASQLATLATEFRLEFQEALKGKKTAEERSAAILEVMAKKGLDVMRHVTTSESGMSMEQRAAFVEAINKFVLATAAADGYTADVKDLRFNLSGDISNASLKLEGTGVSRALTLTESNDRLYEQRLGSDLGLDVTQHAELKESLRALREAPSAEAREAAYKALLAKMTALNLTPDKMKTMVETLQDPKFKFIEGTGTVSYDGPPALNLKHFKTWGQDFYAPGDMTKAQFIQFSNMMTGFAGDGHKGNFMHNLTSFRQLLASLRPDQREAVVKEAQRALNRWDSSVKLAIDGGNLLVDGITSERVWSITSDARNDLRPTVEKFEVGGKQYDLPPNLTDAQKEQLKGVITELGKPPAGTITQAVRDQLAAMLKDVPIGTARTEMLRTINAASAELQKTTFTLEGNRLSIVTDGKPVTPPIEIPAPTAGPADLATAMKELQALINCNVNPDVGLMRKAISDVARLYAKEKGSNFNPAELARMLNGAGMENFKFTIDTTSKPGQTEIVVTDRAGKEINRINTRDIMGDATVAAGPVDPATLSERTDIPDLSNVPEAQRPLVAAIFKANDVQSMLKAISDARKAGLTSFKIGNDVYRIDVKGLGSNTSLVHMTINGKIAVKAVDRNGVFHPQSDGKYFGSSYIGSNPDSPIATRARDLKLTTPQEVSLALKAGALTPGRTSSDAPLSAQQVQDRLKELGVTIPDATNAQTAFKQIQDLQNAITSSKPADIKRALDVLKGNPDVAPQLEGLIAKINASPANALKIEGGAIKLQIGEQKFDIPTTWDANAVRNLARLATTDAKVAAGLYRYMTDAQSAVADKGAIMRNLLNSGLDSKQQAALVMEAFKFESGRNPNYTIQKFVEDLKVIPNAGKPEEPVFEFKGGAFVVSDKAGNVRASIPETDIKVAVAAQQLRNMFDATKPGTDPKKADFNPALLPKADKIAEVLRGLTPAERAKAIADLATDLQSKGIRLDITNPNTTSPRVEMTYENPTTKQQVRDSAAIGDSAAPTVPTEKDAIAFGDAMKQLLARNASQKEVEDLLKAWTDKINTPGLDRNAFVARIKQQLGPNNNLEIVGTGTDAKLVFSGKNAKGDALTATVLLGAPREVAAVAGPRTDVPALDTIKGAPGKEQLIQDIFKAGNINDMLKAIEAAKTAGITKFQIGNDTYGLQVINVGKGTSLVHMTINGKVAVKAVDRNGTFTPQMDGKFFGSNHGNALINARAEQWKLRTPQEVSTTLRAGVTPGDTTVGATVPAELLPNAQAIQDYLKSKGIEGIDPAKAQDVYKQVRDIEIAMRTGNIDNKIRTMLQTIKSDASNPLNAHLAKIVESTNQLTGTADGALKIDPSDLSIKIKLGDNLLPVKPEWSADTIRQLTALAGKDQLLARNLHKYLTDTSVATPDKAKALRELLTQIKDPTQAKTFLTEIFKAERNRIPGYRLNNFKADFAAAAPVGGSIDVVDNTIIYKTGAEVMASIPAAELNRELARTAVQGAFRDLLLAPPLPGMDPKKPDFNPQNLPKAEDIASWLKILSPQQLQEFKQTQLEPLRQALAAKNITLQLTDQNFVEIGYLKDGRATTRDGKPGLDRFKIGGDAAPVSIDQTALNMGTILAEKIKSGATDAQLADYLKTIAGQLNAPGVDRAKFIAQLQTKLDPTGKVKIDLVTSGADAQMVLKRGEGKPDIPVALARREVAATTTGDTRPYAEQLKTLSDYLKLPNPPDKAVLDRMLANLALTHARSTNPPSFDNAKFIDSVKASLTGTGFALFNDTSKTPPEVVLKKGETVVSSPIKGAEVLRAAAAPPDKANASIEDLAKARGIDVSKIPAEGTPQRKLFEAMLRGADGKTLTLLIKELHGKGIRSLELPDANGKMRKMELQVSGHYVHLYAADDSGRMRIAIRGTTDGRPQRGGYFGTRWTESMLGKSIIGTNKDATTPAPEVANPALGTTRPEEYKPNPEAMKAFTDLLTNTPAADRNKPEFQARIAQAFSEAVRSELLTKGKDKATEIEAGLKAALAGKGFTTKFDATTGKFALLKDGTSTAITEVSLTNVPDKGNPETAEQRAARYLEPFGAMDRDQQKAYLAKIATEIGALGLERGKQVIDSMQTQLAKLATTDARLAKTGLSFKNNEIVLEKYGASTRTGRQIESSDSIPVKFNTPVPPGDVRAFSTRLGEILRTTDGKTPTAALDAFKEFAQNIPQANRDGILRSALKTALTAHALLNPNVTADQLKSFNDVIQKFNPAYNVTLGGDGSLSIKGLSPQPDVIQKADLDKARLDYTIVKQMTSFNNEIASLASRGVKDFSSFYGAFANANKDNPALVQAALKLALREQFRLSPDLPLVETLSKYNSAMKNMPFKILYDPMIGTIHFQNQQDGQFKTVGLIKAKEYFTPAKLTEFVGKMSERFIAALGKTAPADVTELVNSLQGFIIDNLNAQQASQLIAEINAKQNAITIKGSRGKLIYARKAA